LAISFRGLLRVTGRSTFDDDASAVVSLAVLKLAMFQAVWLSCAIGAGYGTAWPGIVTATLLVVWHLASAPQWRTTTIVVLAAGTIGFVAESLLIGAGLIRYSASWPTESFAPVWIIGLWLAFSTTLETTRRILGRRPLVKSMLLGLMVGPLTYIGGQRLGALSFAQPEWQGCLAVAIVWGIAYPVLLATEGARHHRL
jgi:hypothetical protein